MHVGRQVSSAQGDCLTGNVLVLNGSRDEEVDGTACLTGNVVVLNGSRDEEVDGTAQKPRVQATDCLKAKFSFSFDRQPHALPIKRGADGSLASTLTFS